MEVTKETETATSSIFSEILPPRPEDAGLEDCALPPESIREAFLKAASAVKSRASSLLSPSADADEGDDCVSGPFPDGSFDLVVGVEVPGEEADGPCVVEKGVAGESGGDLAAPEVGVGGLGDEVVVPGVEEKGGKACVEGLRGLGGVDVAAGGDVAGEDDEAEEEKEKLPTLVEGVARSLA